MRYVSAGALRFKIKDGLLRQQRAELLLPEVVHSRCVVHRQCFRRHIQYDQHIVPVVPRHAVGIDRRAADALQLRGGAEDLADAGQQFLSARIDLRPASSK